jgi:hypothetical protein
MAEPTRIVFTHKEVVESLVRKQGIHEGIWGLYIRFGINAANIGSDPGGDLLPAAIIPVLEIGLQKFDKQSNLSVDAAVVNPQSDRTEKRGGTPKKKRVKVSEGDKPVLRGVL